MVCGHDGDVGLSQPENVQNPGDCLLVGQGALHLHSVLETPVLNETVSFLYFLFPK